MENIYVGLVVLLFILACADLVVGVSNDAVNFLNSAIGSKVSARWLILTVASLGILAGTIFSSGMMEVARNGIFNPGHYTFQDIMVIFISVMFADILLLDVFNTFGMPTSTTVSIVFDLLGASVMVAFLKIYSGSDSIQNLGAYINSAKALAIITAILTSVFISFIVGSIVQFIARSFFSFKSEKRMNIIGTLWCGLSLSIISYFLLVKGIKGATFIPQNFIAYVTQHTLSIYGMSFAFFTILMGVLRVFKINILRITVLAGTFALAMAFASNDLVNFIGVPIAGFQSYHIWAASGQAPGDLLMTALAAPVHTQGFLLLGAGFIMVLTMTFSKKARTVTETEVNLARQEEGLERFAPNTLSRGLVGLGISVSSFFQKLLPGFLKRNVAKSFDNSEHLLIQKDKVDPPAFDLVRASVNLTVASVLIASATSLKLPLSTTYVSFMVAMGTSLSDKAWGRDSAVYRVAGVFNVIGGWFLTAMVAFLVSATFAFFVYEFEIYGMVAILGLLIYLVIRSYALHRVKDKQKEDTRKMEQVVAASSAINFIRDTRADVTKNIREIADVYGTLLASLIDEDEEGLRKGRKALKSYVRFNNDSKGKLTRTIKLLAEADVANTRQYVLIFDLEQDLVQSMQLVADNTLKHVKNKHMPIKGNLATLVKQLVQEVPAHMKTASDLLDKAQFKNYRELMLNKYRLYERLDSQIEQVVEFLREDKYSSRANQLILKVLLETKDILAVSSRFVRIYKEIEENLNSSGETARGSEMRPNKELTVKG